MVCHKAGAQVDEGLFRELHSQGLTDSALAEALGISRLAALRLRRKLGLNPNRGVGKRGPGRSRKRRVTETCGRSRAVEDGLAEEMLFVLAAKGRIPKEKIDAVARRCNRDYHQVLSLLGNLSMRGVVGKDASCGGCPWRQGEAAAKLLEGGLSVQEVARLFDVSRAQIHKWVDTYRAFPDPASREPELSWQHHWVAARYAPGEARAWLEKARESGWSTRELEAALKGGEVETVSSLRAKLAEQAAELEALRAKASEADALRARVSELARRVQELEARVQYYETECVVLTKEQAALLPTVGHLFALYERIADLERRLEARRRLFAGLAARAGRARAAR